MPLALPGAGKRWKTQPPAQARPGPVGQGRNSGFAAPEARIDAGSQSRSACAGDSDASGAAPKRMAMLSIMLFSTRFMTDWFRASFITGMLPEPGHQINAGGARGRGPWQIPG